MEEGGLNGCGSLLNTESRIGVLTNYVEQELFGGP